MRPFLFALICSLTPFAAQAQGFIAYNRLAVIPLGGQDFEVIEARGAGAQGMWCAAADFAIKRLGRGSKTRLYVKEPRGPSRSVAGRTGVVFTINPNGITPRTAYSVSVRQKGLGLPVIHAFQFCKDYDLLFDE